MDILIPKGTEIPCLQVACFEYTLANDFVIHVNVGESKDYGFYNFHHVDCNRTLLEIQFSAVKLAKCNKANPLHDLSDEIVLCIVFVNEACQIWSLGICKYHYWFHKLHPVLRIVYPIVPRSASDRKAIQTMSSQMYTCFQARRESMANPTDVNMDALRQAQTVVLQSLKMSLQTNVFTVDEDMVLEHNLNVTVNDQFEEVNKDMYINETDDMGITGPLPQ